MDIHAIVHVLSSLRPNLRDLGVLHLSWITPVIFPFLFFRAPSISIFDLIRFLTQAEADENTSYFGRLSGRLFQGSRIEVFLHMITHLPSSTTSTFPAQTSCTSEDCRRINPLFFASSWNDFFAETTSSSENEDTRGPRAERTIAFLRFLQADAVFRMQLKICQLTTDTDRLSCWTSCSRSGIFFQGRQMDHQSEHSHQTNLKESRRSRLL